MLQFLLSLAEKWIKLNHNFFTHMKFSPLKIQNNEYNVHKYISFSIYVLKEILKKWFVFEYKICFSFLILKLSYIYKMYNGLRLVL